MIFNSFKLFTGNVAHFFFFFFFSNFHPPFPSFFSLFYFEPAASEVDEC